MTVLLDTHALHWLVSENIGHLTTHQRQVCATAGLRVSAVSCWELAIHVRKGRLAFVPDFPTWWKQALGLSRAVELPLTSEIVFASESLVDFPRRDPGDRFVAGTAVALKLPLVTVDRAILEWGRTHPEITCVY